jgi:hypothetical protein
MTFVNSLANIPGLCLSITYIDDAVTECKFIVFRFRIKLDVFKYGRSFTTSCDFLDISICEHFDDSYINDKAPDNHAV